MNGFLIWYRINGHLHLKTRNNVAMFIQMIIEGCCKDINIWVSFEELSPLLALILGRQLDMASATFFFFKESIARIADPPVAKHRVYYKDTTLINIFWQFHQVFNWFQGFFITVHPDMANLSSWYQTQETINHPNPCTKNWDNSQLLPLRFVFEPF